MKKVFSMALAIVCSMSMWATDYYLQGGCVASGWNTDLGNLSKCKLEEVSTGVYQWTGVIGALNNFKITTKADWGQLHPSEGATVKINEVAQSVIREGGNDDKWVVSRTGYYTVTLKEEGDTRTLSVSQDVFLIETAQDLVNFAAKVNNGEGCGALYAKLVADIDMNGVEYTPIGCNDKKDYRFSGTFDGQGHKISNLKLNRESAAFIQITTGGATIKNLILDSTCSFEGNGRVAALVNCCNFKDYGETITIENCGNMANVTGTGTNCAAILGGDYGSLNISIKNCFNTGHIKGSSESAVISGWLSGGTNTIDNCWNIGEVTGVDGDKYLWRSSANATNIYNFNGKQGTAIEGNAANGELCYKLNGDQTSIKWYQNLPGDATPVPFNTHAQVYANGALDCAGNSKGGELVYSNTQGGSRDDHNYENCFCTVCGDWDANGMTETDGWFEVSNATQLFWLSKAINEHNDTYSKANIKLTADIDYTAHKQGFIGNGQGTAFRGTFDGQGHTITIDIVNNGTSRTGLFAYINAATIKNLVVEGSATSAGNNCVGGLGGRSDGDGTLIENVIVKTAVSYTGSNGDATCGGLFANMEAKVTVKNCAFIGSINTGSSTGNGGLVGWAGSGSSNQYINCYVAPISYTKSGNSEDIARNKPTITNCYAIASDDARLASGELCYLLNKEVNGGEDWYQTIGTDAAPVPFASHAKVYANGELNCDGTAKEGTTITYANVNEQNRDAHIDVNGFCSKCEALVEDHLTPVDGSFELASKEDVVWFERYVYIVDNAAPAKLTADIDFEGGNTRIGTDARRYCGTFDGQGHKISNFVVDNSESFQGFFGIITGGAHISNIVMDNTCSIKAGSKSGFIGGTKGGGDVYISRIGNEANVTVESVNAAGIIGVDEGGSATLHIDQCYTTGTIKGNAECAQICGWTGDNSTIYNSWSISPVDKIQEGRGFSRYGGTNHDSQFVNCFTTEGEANAGLTHSLSLDAFKSGEVASKLVGMFGQSLGSDEHPVFEGADVYAVTVGAAGWATYVAPATVDLSNIKEANRDNECYTVASIDEYVQLGYAKSVAEGEAIIVKAAEGTYYINSCNNASMDTNLLVASTEEVACNGTQYVLAEKDGVVGFYQANGTIAAGKGYLVYAPADVKAFFFGDTATGIELTPDNGQQTTEIFNLSGQRVSKMQKGINIVNGKKVMF